MDTCLTNPELISFLISDDETYLSKFLDVNTLVEDQTIIHVLYDKLASINNPDYASNKCPSSVLIRKSGRDKYAVVSNIVSNIRRLLMHPKIDFTIGPNREILEVAMFSQTHLYVTNNVLDDIFTRHKLNPDVVSDSNSISRLIYNSCNDIDKLYMFIKHGADIHFDTEPERHNDQPYVAALDNLLMLDVIVENTTHFYCLETTIRRCANTGPGEKNVMRLFELILRHGKIGALEHLQSKGNIGRFSNWLKNVRANICLDAPLMRTCIMPAVESFNLIDDNKNISDIVRKMVLFKHNLECLTQSTIAVPAHKYYDIAIIVLFLMRNPHITVLTCDVLLYITTLVFS